MVAAHHRPQGREVEIKLELDPADSVRLAAHPLLRGASQQQDFVSVYFDTPGETLHKAGACLRIRDIGGRRVQTIKTAKSGGGPFDRFEWEREVRERTPTLTAAERTVLGPLLGPDLCGSLRPVFETRFKRTICKLTHDGSDIELAIDQGEIATAVKRSAISELELELKRGEPKSLFSLARVLAETVPLKLRAKSKAERGYELLHGDVGKPEKAEAIDIPPTLTVGEAFRTVAYNCLRQILANEAATRAGQGESLHQMRIGLRRLRAGLAIFADIVSDEHRGTIKTNLKWITQELGPARDLDVFRADVLSPLCRDHPDDGDLAAARRDFESRHEAAYARVAAALGSSRFRDVLLDLGEWIATGPWTADQGEDRKTLRDRSVAEYARTVLARLRKRVKKKGADLRHLDVKQRHRLRIHAKRLRYATEFFATTFPGETSAERRLESLSALKDLQDALGGLNDLATRHDLIADGMTGNARAARLAASADQAEALLVKSARAYQCFAATKPFWKAIREANLAQPGRHPRREP